MTPSGIRNVLFCVADQWRADALSAAGTAGAHTPNLDALAADGVRFTQHWCQASPCGPARRTLHTGTEVTTHGQWTNDDTAAAGPPTLAATLRSAGVQPVLVGYTDMPTGASLDLGGDSPAEWSSLVDPAFTVATPFIWQHGFPSWRRWLTDRGQPAAPDHPFGLYAPAGPPTDDRLAPAWYDAADSDVAFLTDAALDVIDRWSPTGDGEPPDRPPGLLHLTWLRPHPPMTPPRPYDELIDPDAVTLPHRPLAVEAEAARHPYFARTVPGRPMTEYLQRRCRLDAVDERADRLIRAAYYGLCAEVDHHVGRLMAELRRRGLDESTLVVFTSDHGDALGDHWIYGRRGPFDGHFTVPCIIRDPRPAADATRGTTVSDLTAAIDVYPTICEALGIDVPADVEGRSLLGYLHGAPPPARDHVRYAMSWADHARPRGGEPEGSASPTDDRFVGIRTTGHRYVRFAEGPPLLFDLDDDPAEVVDRSSDPTRSSLAAELDALSRPTP